jgi:hypothetical protein
MSCFGKVSKSWSLCQIGKCGFHQSEVEFLSYIISGDGICMDPHKVQTIVDWATLAFVWDVQCSYGFTNFHR